MRGGTLQMVRCATSAAARRAGNGVLSSLSWIVFAGLDIADQLLCPMFAVLDYFLDGEKRVCYCRSDEIQQPSGVSKEALSQEGAAFTGSHFPVGSWTRISESVNARVRRSGRFHLFSLHRTLGKNLTRPVFLHKGGVLEGIPNEVDEAMSTIPIVEGGRDDSKRRALELVRNANLHSRSLTERSVKSVIGGRQNVKQVARWSDCGCQRCTAWQSDVGQLLYVHVDDKDFAASLGKELNAVNAAAENNIIFLHGFMSSSSFWVDTVLPALPNSVRASHRLFAVDVLGFGRSPKPANCLYTLTDHIDMIRRSVIEPYGIKSFHLVAHSMGCTIALAFAAHYPSSTKSITLIAPPYVPAISGDSSSTYVMEQIAARRIWPLITFGSSVMSWYEHIGRVVCFVICKRHRFWKPLLFFVHSMLPGKKVPLSSVSDFTRHTHHSAWHIFHNTICNGAYAFDHFLEVLAKAGTEVRVIHGTRDDIIPFQSTVSLCKRHPNVRLTAVPSFDHGTVVFGRVGELAEELAEEIFHESIERQGGQAAH